jgi:hypothetical protein
MSGPGDCKTETPYRPNFRLIIELTVGEKSDGGSSGANNRE